jgi:hypothetical protein
MHFTVAIPGQEPSRIEVNRNPFTGRFRIVADDKVVAERSPLSLFTHFSPPSKLVSRVYRYEFAVGHAGRHQVVVEHVCTLLGLRPQGYGIVVDLDLEKFFDRPMSFTPLSTAPMPIGWNLNPKKSKVATSGSFRNRCVFGCRLDLTLMGGKPHVSLSCSRLYLRAFLPQPRQPLAMS